MVTLESLINFSLLAFQCDCARGVVRGCMDHRVKGWKKTCRTPRWFCGFEYAWNLSCCGEERIEAETEAMVTVRWFENENETKFYHHIPSFAARPSSIVQLIP